MLDSSLLVLDEEFVLLLGTQAVEIIDDILLIDEPRVRSIAGYCLIDHLQSLRIILGNILVRQSEVPVDYIE